MQGMNWAWHGSDPKLAVAVQLPLHWFRNLRNFQGVSLCIPWMFLLMRNRQLSKVDEHMAAVAGIQLKCTITVCVSNVTRKVTVHHTLDIVGGVLPPESSRPALNQVHHLVV
jgi:hypothetical protein